MVGSLNTANTPDPPCTGYCSSAGGQ
jgi:hypothetical protein